MSKVKGEITDSLSKVASAAAKAAVDFVAKSAGDFFHHCREKAEWYEGERRAWYAAEHAAVAKYFADRE